jgi:hypothetical protein
MRRRRTMGIVYLAEDTRLSRHKHKAVCRPVIDRALQVVLGSRLLEDAVAFDRLPGEVDEGCGKGQNEEHEYSERPKRRPKPARIK